MKTAFLAVASVVLCLSACGDDGNDRALIAQRLVEKAAAFRSAETTVPTTVAPQAPDVSPSSSSASSSAPSTAPAIPTTGPSVEPTGVVVQVIALDNIFRPDAIEIHPGDEVLWENRGQNEHNVLYVDSDEWGVETAAFQPGDVYTHVFTQPGEYRYYCSIHGSTTVGMVGTVIVTD